MSKPMSKPMSKIGQFYGVGLGIATAQQMTKQAHECIARVAVIAYPTTTNEHHPSRARSIASSLIAEHHIECPCLLPIHKDAAERAAIYQSHAKRIEHYLKDGKDVAYLCLGDPLLYGSYWHIQKNLTSYQGELCSGLSSFSQAAALAHQSLAMGNDALTLTPFHKISDYFPRLATGEGMVILKSRDGDSHLWQMLIGQLDQLDLMQHSLIAITDDQSGRMTIAAMTKWRNHAPPYFSLILIPSQEARQS